jgi:hypothetical protein
MAFKRRLFRVGTLPFAEPLCKKEKIANYLLLLRKIFQLKHIPAAIALVGNFHLVLGRVKNRLRLAICPLSVHYNVA